MNALHQGLLSAALAGLLSLALACTNTTPGDEVPKETRPPGLRPHPEQVAFTCVSPGCDTSEVVQVVVIGTRRVAIKRILLEGEAAADFTVTPSEEAPFIVGPSSNFLLDVRYAPLGAPVPGTVEIRVTYTDASPEESEDRLEAGELVIPLVRRLVGEPVLSARPEVLSFGVVAPGESKELSLDALNEGFGNIALELAKVESGHGEVKALLPEQKALGPGKTLAVPVTFAPAGEGYVQTELLLTATPSYVSPVKVKVEGTSLTTASLAAFPSTEIDFGLVKKGATRQMSLQLVNQGGAALNVSSVSVNDATGSVSVTAPAGGGAFTLGPLERVTVPLNIEGKASGEVDARIVVASDDPLYPLFEIRVLGTITEPMLGLTPTGIDFGKVPVGWAVTQSVELRNTGWGKLKVKHITMVAGSSSLFTIARMPALPLELEREERVAVDVQFRAETAATFNGWLSVESEDATKPFTEIPITAQATSCLDACPIANGTASCQAGSCAVGACNASWHDTDGSPATGCECKELQPSVGKFCTNSHFAGVLVDNEGDSATFTGNLPVDGDEELIRFFAKDGFTWFGEDFKVKIRLDSADPNIRMCVYRQDGAQTTECHLNNETCPTNRFYQRNGSAGGEDEGNYYVRVHRAPGTGPTCTTYTVFMSNGI